MDRYLEKLNLPRLNQEEIEIMDNPIPSTEIEAVIKKISLKTKAQNQMTSQVNSIKHLEKTSKSLSKSCRGRTTSKLNLQGYHHPDAKTRQRQPP